MPIIGNRIPVKLPWKGATNNDAQYVSMKSSVALYLGLKPATKEELEYDAKISKKNKDGQTGNSDRTTIKRRRRPGYRQRAVKITFRLGRPAGNGRPSTVVGKKQKIGKDSVASCQFPITRSTSINDVINWFESGAGSSLGVFSVTDMTTGQSYPIAKKFKV